MQFVNHSKSAIPSLLSQFSRLSPQHIQRIQAAAHVFPFRANNYVVEQLIDWDNVPNCPIFKLTFPQPEMLLEDDMKSILHLMETDPNNRERIRMKSIEIRKKLNPHPAKQKELNVPRISTQDTDGSINHIRVPGVQHKYPETMLFFPSEAQWCHAYCTYCFRWAQFTEVGGEQQFKSKDVTMLTDYIAQNPQLTDILFTGGDPAVMRTEHWKKYLLPLVSDENQARLEHLTTVRIGTKSLTYWPYRYTENEDADDFLRLLERLTECGKHVTIQAHFTHPQELSTKACAEAVRRLRMTGANIRSQAPIVKGINDEASVWETMWKKQVGMGIIPYYMFVERDTGPKHYFELPLAKAYQVFKEAVSRVSGIARTVRGPSMSCEPGKIAVTGIIDDMMILQFLQARNPQWMQSPFLAKLDPNACWIDDLKPYNNADKQFFYQKELDDMINAGVSSGQMVNGKPKISNIQTQSTETTAKLKSNGLNGHSNGHVVNGKKYIPSICNEKKLLIMKKSEQIKTAEVEF